MKPAKAKGQRGSWFAEVDGELLPCVHKYWIKGLDHHDRFRRHEGANEQKIQDLVAAVRTGKRVILTDDKTSLDRDGNVIAFERTTYIAIYAVEDVSYSPADGLRFRLSQRIRDLE